jgi:hypothetical protein
LDDDKIEYQNKSYYGFDYTHGETSQFSSPANLRRKSFATSDNFRGARARSERLNQPTVQNQFTKNKRRKSTTGNSSSDSSKLGTFDGVFTPTVLSIWGIIVFLRFGFIIAQVGVIATLMMFSVGYLCVI